MRSAAHEASSSTEDLRSEAASVVSEAPSSSASSLRVDFHLPLTSRPLVHPTADGLSEEEQKILSDIQDLQRQLWELKSAETTTTTDAAQADDEPNLQGIMGKNRLVMVSNRLPLKRKVRDDGTCSYTMADGGLVTALSGVREELDFIWVGWMGCEIPVEDQPAVRAQLLNEHNCLPVFLSDQLVRQYYNGFCNDVLWPLFHYVPLPMYKAGGERKFDTELWEAYKEANRMFATAIMGVFQPTDLIWVHDYHLMNLPAELRKREPTIQVAWFLHTPFPTSEIYRILPVRKELLEGLLKADLIGFQTYDYARHFLSSCSRVLEERQFDSSPKGIEYNDHFSSVGVFPVGIDPDYVRALSTSPRVRRRIGELIETFAGRKILLGVDRVDYIKGMPHKLLGLELFLQRYPEWQGKVTLIQVGVPTREDVHEYKQLSLRVNELVGRINGTHGTLEYSPIHYINQYVSQEELFAIYHVADVCLVTSVRDGMNLVSHEYVAAQDVFVADFMPSGEGAAATRDGPGVLVLSEFAGSAQSLSGAIRVNPWNTEELATAIHSALTLSKVERELRHHKLFRYVSTHTAGYWAKSLVREFRSCAANKPSISKLPKLNMNKVVKAYERAKNRLIISDYDGTLMRIQTLPQLATPAPTITNLLDTLCRDPRNTIFIVSGRERRFMETWLGDLRIGLAAEHGFYHRMPDSAEWQSIGQKLELSWKDVVIPIMTYFMDRTPGSYIEPKESSLTWHYRDADPHFGAWQAKDLQLSMEDVLSNLPLEILQGNRMVEVRHRAISNSSVIEKVLEHLSSPESVAEHNGNEVDFVLCVGDDRADEDTFQLLSRWRERLNGAYVEALNQQKEVLAGAGPGPGAGAGAGPTPPLGHGTGAAAGGEAATAPAIRTGVSIPAAGAAGARSSGERHAGNGLAQQGAGPGAAAASPHEGQPLTRSSSACSETSDPHQLSRGSLSSLESKPDDGGLSSPEAAAAGRVDGQSPPAAGGGGGGGGEVGASAEPSAVPPTPPPTEPLPGVGEAGGDASAPLAGAGGGGAPAGAVDVPATPPPPPLRRPPATFLVHIGADPSHATSYVESTTEFRRILRAFATISKKDEDLRSLGASAEVPVKAIPLRRSLSKHAAPATTEERAGQAGAST